MSTVRCPGAVPLAGPPLGGPSVICGPLAIDQKADAVSQQGKTSQVVFTSRHDPGTYRHACCDRYDLCTIWQEEKKRIAARQVRFVGEERGPTSLNIEDVE